MTYQYIMLVADNDTTKIASIMQLPIYDFFFSVSYLVDKSKLK